MPTNIPRLLVIEDDRDLCRMLSAYLLEEGFVVTMVHDGETGGREALRGGYDIVLLDVMLPQQSGLDVLRQIRRESDIPVVMLTVKADDTDRIVGLELGADDYLLRSCNPRELLARLRAILRRVGRERSGAWGKVELPDTSGVIIFPGERKATWRDRALNLTSTEFSMLEFLVVNAGKTVTRHELSEQVFGRPFAAYDRNVDVHMSKLRNKLRAVSDSSSPIQTVHGVGYQFLRA